MKKEKTIDSAFILQWLKENPDFLQEHLSSLYPEREDKAVVDLHGFARQKMAKQLEELQQKNTRLEEQFKLQSKAFAFLQESTLDLLDAASFGDLIHVITADLPSHLHVDLISLVLEKEDSLKGQEEDLALLEEYNIRTVPGQLITQLLKGKHWLIRELPQGSSPQIHGEKAEKLRGEVLIRLHIHPMAPLGLMALGTYSPSRFQQEQDIQPVIFLARIIEKLLVAWLTLEDYE
ncbi:MAG: DUF484 family protein [Alphaproteobacteria bacterium]